MYLPTLRQISHIGIGIGRVPWKVPTGMYMTSAETALGLENKRDSSDATDRSTVMVRLGTQVVLCAARMMMIEEE